MRLVRLLYDVRYKSKSSWALNSLDNGVGNVVKRYFSTLEFIFILGVTVCCSVALAGDKPVFNDWFALGSGCRARSDLPGDVQLKIQPDREGSPNLHVARFFLKNFKLSDNNTNRDLRQFGRECAIRLNINPPPGKKIFALHARSKLTVKKSPGYALDLLSELKLGPVSLGRDNQKYLVTDVQHYRKHEVSLSAGSDMATSLPQLGCGEPKIIGFDYSWIVSERQPGQQIVTVELADDSSILIEAVLSDCGS